MTGDYLMWRFKKDLNLNCLKKSLAFVKTGSKVDSLFYKVDFGDNWKIYSNYDQMVINIENIELPKIFYRDCSLYTSNAWIECGHGKTFHFYKTFIFCQFLHLDMTPFFRTEPHLYHKYGKIIFRSGNLYSVCSPGNQDYQEIIHF